MLLFRKLQFFYYTIALRGLQIVFGLTAECENFFD
jgi:hypothetical protein